MTCIVGIVDNGIVYMGADSIGSNGWTKTQRSDKKIHRVGEMLFGFTGSYRMAQILAYSFTPNPQTPEQTVDQYMRSTFIDAVRDALTKGGYTIKENGREEGGSFLVGYRGRLFHVENDFQVGECSDGYDACGSGALHALATLYNLPYLPPRKRILAALKTAEHFIISVGGPFHIETLKPRAVRTKERKANA